MEEHRTIWGTICRHPVRSVLLATPPAVFTLLVAIAQCWQSFTDQKIPAWAQEQWGVIKKTYPMWQIWIFVSSLSAIYIAGVWWLFRPRGEPRKNHFSTRTQPTGRLSGNKSSVLEIVDAKYGAKDCWVDATDEVRRVVEESGGAVLANTAHLRLKDPIHGIVKQLLIRYSIDGREMNLTIAENETLNLFSDQAMRRSTNTSVSSQKGGASDTANNSTGAPTFRTLRELFESDFPHLTKTFNEVTCTRADNSIIGNIRYFVHHDFSAHSKFLSCYVGNSNFTYDLCEVIARLSQRLLDEVKGLRIISKHPGDSSEVGSDKLVFTRVVYIYHEDSLSLSQRGDLSRIFESENLNVQFRSWEYVTTMMFQASAK